MGSVGQRSGGLAHLRADGAPAGGFIVEDKKALLGLARLWGVAGENARDGRAAPEKGGVAGEVDVCVDVDEELLGVGGHGGAGLERLVFFAGGQRRGRAGLWRRRLQGQWRTKGDWGGRGRT